jgi:hypothetical protein
VQFEVDRHDDALGRPGREHQFHDLRPVLAGDRNSGTRGSGLSDGRHEAQRPFAELAPGAHLAVTVEYRPAVAETGGGLIQKCEQVHRGDHSEDSANSDRYLVELQPPSTTIVCPLMKLPPGEHRNATVLAISSILPSR